MHIGVTRQYSYQTDTGDSELVIPSMNKVPAHPAILH